MAVGKGSCCFLSSLEQLQITHHNGDFHVHTFAIEKFCPTRIYFHANCLVASSHQWVGVDALLGVQTESCKLFALHHQH